MQSHVPSSSRVPSLSDNKVACIGERNGVSGTRGAEVYIATRLVVLIVVLAAHKARDVGEVKVRNILDWSGSRNGERARSNRKCGGEIRKGNHFVRREAVVARYYLGSA